MVFSVYCFGNSSAHLSFLDLISNGEYIIMRIRRFQAKRRPEGSFPPMKTTDYGIDKPDRLRGLAMGGLLLFGMGLSQYIALRNSGKDWSETVLFACLWVGVLLIAAAGFMLWSSKNGKIQLASKMLDDLKWSGNEKVLDVGCGRGLLAILAARKIPQGNSVGIDIWSQEDLGENTIEAANENAQIENVAERVRFEDGDVMDLRYGPNVFDKIVSSFCLSSLKSSNDRRKALIQLLKLLRPGGEIAILDTLHAGDYGKILAEQGMTDIRLSPTKFLFCLPARYVIARKKDYSD